MNRQEQIDALQKALASLDSAIAQVQAALAAAASLSDIAQLNAQLARLQAERQTDAFELANLQAAAGEIAAISPENAAKVRTLSGDLDRAIVAAATVSATLDFANTVLGKASDIRKALG